MRAARVRCSATALSASAQCRHISDARPFSLGDLVLLRQKQDRSAPPILTRPLQHGKRIEGHRGIIQHDEIIGRRVRDIVKSTTTRSARAGTDYRLHQVTLDDYVRLTKRLVTPIYPSDANLIVSLLDLHPGAVETDKAGPDQRLEILEAGTGHGALTLYLSRAIHAANSCSAETDSDYQDDAWKARRRAVIHTTDVSPRFAAHAQSVVQGFRKGIYARNVDFHVGDVGEVVESLRKERGGETFLSHAFLDLPSAQSHLKSVAQALRVDGTLMVFNPSITQITECATMVKEQQVPLDLDKVVELGVNGSSGGREWDVRFVRPRAESRAIEQASRLDNASQQSQLSAEAKNDVSTDSDVSKLEEEHHWAMVCRPLVGERITGGGFLGLWRKQRDMRFEA